jgi:hypothetical protein
VNVSVPDLATLCPGGRYLELVSKSSSAAVDEMRAATPSNFAKKSLRVSQWIHLRFFRSISSSRLASRQPRYKATSETSASSLLDYEKLDVCRIALEFFVTTAEIRDRLPRGNGELQDQCKRASFSIVLNTAEGAGKLKQVDKRRYFLNCTRVCHGVWCPL